MEETTTKTWFLKYNSEGDCFRVTVSNKTTVFSFWNMVQKWANDKSGCNKVSIVQKTETGLNIMLPNKFQNSVGFKETFEKIPPDAILEMRNYEARDVNSRESSEEATVSPNSDV